MPMMPDTQQPNETSKDAETSTVVPAVEPTAQDIAATEVPSKLTVSNSSSMGKPIRDSSWLELDVCRDFMRGYQCPRGEQCRFAHPEQGVLTKENKVTCCYDFLKDRCFREHCKYFHPPAHIKERLVTAGKQFGAMMSNMYFLPAGGPFHPTPVIGFDGCVYAQTPHAGLLPAPVMSPFGAVTDRLHICPEFLRGQCNVELCPFVHPEPQVRHNFDSTVTVCHDYIRGNCAREWCRYYHPPQHITTQLNPQPALRSFVTPQGVHFIAPTAAVPASMPAPVFPTTSVMYPTPLSITGAAQTSINPFTVTSPIAPVTSVPHFIPGSLPNYPRAVIAAAAGPMSAMPVMMPYSSPVSTVVPIQSLASPLSVIQPPSPPSMDLVNGHQGIPTE